VCVDESFPLHFAPYFGTKLFALNGVGTVCVRLASPHNIPATSDVDIRPYWQRTKWVVLEKQGAHEAQRHASLEAVRTSPPVREQSERRLQLGLALKSLLRQDHLRLRPRRLADMEGPVAPGFWLRRPEIARAMEGEGPLTEQGRTCSRRKWGPWASSTMTSRPRWWHSRTMATTSPMSPWYVGMVRTTAACPRVRVEQGGDLLHGGRQKDAGLRVEMRDEIDGCRAGEAEAPTTETWRSRPTAIAVRWKHPGAALRPASRQTAC